MDVKKIGEAIRYLRLKEGYTQQDIADFLQISFQAVSKWERGLCVPDVMYLSRLAEHLNVDLDDLLEGNITYLDDEWRGVLMLSDIQLFNDEEIYWMCDILLSYFMLAGIRRIAVKTDSEAITKLKIKYQDGREWGIKIEYLDIDKKTDIYCNTMFITMPVFIYGTNLTKYFWRAMNRRNGVSILTARAGNKKEEERVVYDNQNLIKEFHNGDDYILPILFVPRSFGGNFEESLNHLAEKGQLYAEPAARGLITKVIRSREDLKDSMDLKLMIENATGEKLYDLNEISRMRGLNQ